MTSTRPHHWVRWLLLSVVVLLVAMWVYIFGFAPRSGAYRVRDDAWRRSAQSLCLTAEEQRVALADVDGGRITNPTAEQISRHADLVDQATAILTKMVDDLAALPVTSERDQLTVETFVKYYRVLLDDRGRYTARLRRGDLRPYDETLVNGGPVTNVLTDFTSGNDVKACAPPGELGEDAGN